MSFSHSFGAGLPGISAVVMTMSHFLGLRAEQRVLGVDELLAHLLRVAALPFARFLDRHGEELAAERLHLLLGRGAHVERAHDRADALRGAERGESGNPGADDQHLRRRDLAGRRELTGEEAREPIRRFDHGAIARDVRHRRQRVHLLGAADPWHLIHRERRDLARRELREQRFVLRGIQERDDRAAFAQLIDLAVFRRTNLHHDVRRPRGRAIDELGTGRRVLVIAKRRCGPRALFDNHLPPSLHPLADYIGRCGDAPFLGFRLLDDA